MITRRALMQSAVYLPLVYTQAPPALPAGAACRIVWVWPTGERLEASQAHAARGELQQALAYWNARAPRPGAYVAREEALRIDDPYTTWQWLRGLALPDVITVAVVVNLASRRLVDLGGGVAAPAYHWPGRRTLYASLVSSADYSDVGVGAQVAHELGHALYDLADGDPGQPMMGPYPEEWARWVSRQPCQGA